MIITNYLKKSNLYVMITGIMIIGMCTFSTSSTMQKPDLCVIENEINILEKIVWFAKVKRIALIKFGKCRGKVRVIDGNRNYGVYRCNQDNGFRHVIIRYAHCLYFFGLRRKRKADMLEMFGGKCKWKCEVRLHSLA